MVYGWYMLARMLRFFHLLVTKAAVRRRLSVNSTACKSVNSQPITCDAVGGVTQRLRLDKLMSTSSSLKYAIIILNCDVAGYSFEDYYFEQLWAGAAVKFVVDGGANALQTFLVAHADATSDAPQKRCKPDVVCGDFDSIRPEILEKYQRDPDVQVMSTPDQNATDFVKSLKLLQEHCDAKSVGLDYIVAVHAGAGRFDHLMGNLNALYRAKQIFASRDAKAHAPHLVLLSFMPKMSNETLPPTNATEVQLQTLLDPGVEWRIHVSPESVGSSCGLIPLSGATRVRTEGLRWNVGRDDESSVLELGKLVSTSNEIAAETIAVEAKDNPVLWTCIFRIPLKQHASLAHFGEKNNK